MVRKGSIFAFVFICAGAICPRFAGAMSWTAEPLTVHEWGVQVFDWGTATAARPELPAFVHTDVHPGLAVAAPQKRVKDLPPDSGMRFKPVLYFYLPEQDLGEAIVGVEMRFAYGHANAWFPQANVYRTPAMTANVREPDWNAWRMRNATRSYGATQVKPSLPVPDDPRMELAWYRLALSKGLPAAGKLPDVAADHWINTARQVQSAYVSNGMEAEKFLFYEGATREKSAFAIIPDEDSFGVTGKAQYVVNVAETPIYNVFAIYRRDHHAWVGYAPTLEPIKSQAGSQPGGAGSTITALTLPDFDRRTHWTDDSELAGPTTDRLLAVLTGDDALSINHGMRDPADPQGPTQSGQLFPDEARALEKIWHDEFFGNEGFTILYRESPAALDQAMPLNLYTDMYHYIKLSRCGLVVCKNIDTRQLRQVYYGARSFANMDAKGRNETIPVLRSNRHLTEGAIAYFERLGQDPNQLAKVRAVLDEK
jgi:hypothetical protein